MIHQLPGGLNCHSNSWSPVENLGEQDNAVHVLQQSDAARQPPQTILSCIFATCSSTHPQVTRA